MSTTETIKVQESTAKKEDPTPSSSSINIPDAVHSGPPKKTAFQKFKSTAYSIFLRYWFLLGLGIVIGLAWAFPQVGKAHGSIQAQYTVKWGAVIVIFLLSGLGLEVSVMLRTILRWRLHFVVQVINFILLPFLMYGIVRFFIAVHANLSDTVYKGWMIALATTLFNAALGNVLGIFVSPGLMTAFQNDEIVFQPGTARGNPDYVNVLKTLGLTVLAPLVVGQFIRFLFPKQIKYIAAKCRFPIINSLALLCLVWSVFCDGVASDAFHRTSGVDIVAIIFVDIFMYLFGCATCIYIARLPWPTKNEPKWVSKWRFSRKDTVAIMYCGATKTVSMGIPLINVLYANTSYGIVGLLSLPLLMYHICQLFLGNFQVAFLKKWVQKDERDDMSHPDDTNEQVLPSTDTSAMSTLRKRNHA
ncbi:hypothetical protein G6F70_001474 [Rhizopus microsporus]|nr:hypothetical protein G6F71_000211 [Rhizopus microsporus]KAG1203324.1 hypothetical protein G6F70_001474 [Rhizopus microsporus]KAG1212149.1 hypothetical protein G6F69_003960 [Rhizopus microsporus]KAG1238911.1 hypothetical protein G6F67_000009 [Rhizopus microsporus]KAG1267460.1 hypothetical protein G6F68_001932 [Rhizopus microsporus]